MIIQYLLGCEDTHTRCHSHKAVEQFPVRSAWQVSEQALSLLWRPIKWHARGDLIKATTVHIEIVKLEMLSVKARAGCSSCVCWCFQRLLFVRLVPARLEISQKYFRSQSKWQFLCCWKCLSALAIHVPLRALRSEIWTAGRQRGIGLISCPGQAIYLTWVKFKIRL